jgi:hypothetical protein
MLLPKHANQTAGQSIRTALPFASIATASLLISVLNATAAGPPSKWGLDPETSKWFKDLRAPNGTPCCSYVDGMQLDDVDYRENPDGTFEVHIINAQGDRWEHVDKNHIINPPDRKVDYAIVWPYTWSPAHNGDHSNGVYCFMPGVAY